MNVKIKSSTSLLTLVQNASIKKERRPDYRGMMWILAVIAFNFMITFEAIAGVSPDIVANETSRGGKADIIEKSDRIYVNITTPNKAGISKNSFSDLDSQGKKIYLVNTPTLNSNVAERPAKTIVIDVGMDGWPDLRLGDIEVLGEQANIVVAGPFIYIGGEIKNAKRVVLATGRILYGDDGNINTIMVDRELGDESGSPWSNGTVFIDGHLHAPGTVFLDVVAQMLWVIGDVSTNLRGDKINDEIIISDSGNQVIASGDLEMIAGQGTYHYKSSMFTPLFTPSGSSDIGMMIIHSSAEVSSGSVNLSAYGNNLHIKNIVTTEADLRMVSQINGVTVVPDGSIHINSYGDVLVKDALRAKNTIEINALEDIQVFPYDDVNFESMVAKKINLVAGNMFFNDSAFLKAEDIYIAAGSITNYGDIFATYGLYLSGENSIDNLFGGKIIGAQISLVSDGPVSNGLSITLDEYRNYFSEEFKRTIDTYPGEYANIEHTDEAVIWGEFVDIHAFQLRTANSYRKSITFDEVGNPLVLDSKLSDQVIISGDYYLKADLTKESDREGLNIISVSGSIIESAYGELQLISDESIKLDRYVELSTHSVTEESTTVNTDAFIAVGWAGFKLVNSVTEGSTTVNTDYVSLISPPGRISSGGRAVIKAETLENYGSTIEVLGDIDANIRHVDMKGYTLDTETVTTTFTPHEKRYCARRVLGACVKRKTRRWTTASYDTSTVEVGNIPFIVNAEGNITQGFGYETVTLNGDVQDINPYVSGN